MCKHLQCTCTVYWLCCIYMYTVHVHVYRKVPSERPHPCNRPPPPPVFFPSERLVSFKRPLRPKHWAWQLCQRMRNQLYRQLRYALALRRCHKTSDSRRIYTVEYKLGLLRWYQDNGENKHATTRNFGIDRKRLREWLEKADRLRDNQVGAAKKKWKLNAGKEPLSLELDQAVLRFLEEERVAISPYT